MGFDLDPGPQFNDAAHGIAALLKLRSATPAAAHIRFGLDPIGAAAVAGGGPLAWTALAREFNGIIAGLAGRGFRGPFATADARLGHG